jgi:peptidoglycan/LPS O-acetylase OafA/YrhL
MRYRPDIDGLRALAVALVVLFHAELAPFAGGFVGVDVFFVISGYLVTAIVTSQCDRGTFSLRAFYESRLRRIVPALVLMVLLTFVVCSVLGICVDDPRGLRRSARAALLFHANAHFHGATGYFDIPAHTQVFLHTWSLGVEGQFYLLHPLLVLACHRWWPRRLAAVLLATAAVSFALCLATMRTDPAGAFFLLPARAWELLLGGVLATTGWTPRTQAGKRALVGGGLTAIVATAVAYGSVVDPAFPGWAALPPVLGAAACIAGGTGLVDHGRVLRLLVHPAVLLVGQASYSIYLWHWPALVVTRRVSFDPQLEPPALVAALTIGGVAAVASWRLVEAPARRWLAGLTAPLQYAVVAGGLVLAWLPSQVLRTQVFLTDRQAALAAGAADRVAPARGTLIGAADGPPRFLLLGDSHAEAVSEAFARAATAAGVTGRVFPTAVLVNAHRARAHDRRAEQEADLRRFVAADRYEAVYIVKRWTLDIEGYLPAESDDPALDDVGLVHEAGGTRLVGPPALAAALDDTVTFLKEHGVRRIYLVLPIPECGRNIPQAASFLSLFHDEAEIAARLGVTEAEYRDRNATSLRILAGVAAAHEGVELIDPWAVLGRPGGRSRVLDAGRCLYYDDDHLSIAGSLTLLPLLAGRAPFAAADPPERLAALTGGDDAPPAATADPGAGVRPARR